MMKQLPLSMPRISKKSRTKTKLYSSRMPAPPTLGMIITNLLAFSLLATSDAIAEETTSTDNNKSAEKIEVTDKTGKASATISDFTYDWYTTQQLEQWRLTDPSTPAPDPICGGTYWEPPRKNLSLIAPLPDSIKGAADRYEFEAGKKAVLEGNVIIQQLDYQIESERMRLDFEQNKAFVDDTIRFRDNGLLLEAESAEIDLTTKEAFFDNARYTLHEQHSRGTAKRLHNAPPNKIFIEKGIYTGCRPGSDDWYFRGQEIELDAESGWGTAKQMSLHIQHIPVLYLPYFRFPIDGQRHTGFLYPTFDSLSEPDVSIPLYINLAPNYDATITPRKIGGRGTLLQTEFRYLSPLFGKGQLDLAAMENDRQFNDQSRKSGRWQQWQVFGSRTELAVELNYVSDSEYLDDFGTDLSTISDSHLLRELELTYQQPNWGITTRLQAYQTIDESVSDVDRPYRRLPEITLFNDESFDINADLFLNWQQVAQVVYFAQPLAQHNADNPAYVSRAHYQSTLSTELSRSWGFLTPAVDLYLTHYQLNGLREDAAINGDESETQSRSLGSFSLDSGLFFDRPLEGRLAQLMGSDNSKLRQSLEPRLFWLYVPEKNQDDIPVLDTAELTFGMSQLFRKNRFSGFDRIGDAQQMTAAITTRITDDQTGRELLQASLGQIFYFEDREVQLDESIEPDTSSTSPIVGSATLRLGDYWQTQATLEWDPQNDRIDQSHTQINYLVSEHEIYHLGYRFRQESSTDEEINQIDAAVIYPYSPEWDLVAAWNVDIDSSQTLEQLTGVIYYSCCWRSSLVYRRRIEDTNEIADDPQTTYSLMLEFELLGLGQLGGRLKDIMKRTIYGYDQFVE